MGMRLGLDLQGGIHWVLGVKLEEAEHQELSFLRESLEAAAREDGFALESVSVEGNRLVVVAADATAAEKVREWAKNTGALTEQAQRQPPRVRAQPRRDRGGPEARHGPGARGAAAAHHRSAQGHRGLGGHAAGRGPRAGPDPGRAGRSRERSASCCASTGFLEFKIVKDQAQNEELLRAKYPDGLPGRHARSSPSATRRPTGS